MEMSEEDVWDFICMFKVLEHLWLKGKFDDKVFEIFRYLNNFKNFEELFCLNYLHKC